LQDGDEKKKIDFFREYNASIGNELNNNWKMIDSFKEKVSKFGNETGLCDNIM
jgi:hypothetical protein